MLLKKCFRASLVASWNCTFFYGATPLKSIVDLHFADEFLFFVLTFSINNFLDAQL
jgi:hypothetical protein